MRIVSLFTALVVAMGGVDASEGVASPAGATRSLRQPQSPVTDLHFHAQPFGGPSIPYQEQLSYFERTHVLFVLLYGIGQQLPHDSSCRYYLDCIGTPARPGIKNDFENAANYVEHPRDDIHVAMSMTFPDLTRPEDVAAGIRLLDKEYPGLFQWMGEVNLHKEGLRGNGHVPATIQHIARWKDFMAVLEQRGIPLEENVRSFEIAQLLLIRNARPAEWLRVEVKVGDR
jgi:hypothetical protein